MCNPFIYKRSEILLVIYDYNKYCSIRMGNNPMVGATVAVAVAIQEAADADKF